jgi:hypothetical protein
MPSFAASFFRNFHQIKRIWRKRVGVENNTDWNLKDLEEMLGSAKALKRNNRKCKGILIGPLKAPRFLAA